MNRLKILERFSKQNKNTQISNFIKNRPSGQTGMTKLIVVFFAILQTRLKRETDTEREMAPYLLCL
jgi:predicted RND superfamily exporter protein